ncbi:hypothetical protein Thiofri_03827 [Thiorhodovibrio frisius]|nr:hypothetical protein Thiofri_03827 [Thiorhodovibrio frisius]
MPLTLTRHGVLPAGGTNPSALSDKFFSGLYTFSTEKVTLQPLVFTRKIA